MALEPTEALEFFRLSNNATSAMYSEALEDLRFSVGDGQWPVQIQQSRQLEQRPCLTINKLDAYCRRITNEQRQQRPRIKVHAVNNIADPKIAEILQGVIRHIEVNSDSDQAYDNAGNFQVRMGFGYWRLLTEYASDTSFDQEIRIRQIENAFSVSFDPNSSLPDGSDSERCIVSDLMTKKAFKLAYPDADNGQGWHGDNTGELYTDWIQKEDIRVAEYFYIDKVKSKLVQLSDGNTLWEDEIPKIQHLMEDAGVSVVQERLSWRKSVKWCKQTALEILEERTLPGRWIPVIPVYGESMILDGRRKRWGITKQAKDPQRMVNFWETSATESLALAPKAKWMLAEGQQEGHENEWAQANTTAKALLLYKQTDAMGQQAPPPQRLQPEPPPIGMFTALAGATNNLREVIGMTDPAQRVAGNVSGKALRAEQFQNDQSNFHYYDNITRSIRHTGKIILDWIPAIYDTQRVVRIIGDDGRPDLVTLNERSAIGKILNDVTIGEYDVIMDTGPGYNSKREEAVEVFGTMLGTPLGEKIAQVADDLIVRNLDVPGADIIADRLAAVNPLAQIDEKSDIPPGVQMKIKQMQQMIQQQGGVIQGLQQEIKLKTGIEQLKQQGETRRALIAATTKAHDTEQTQASWRHEVETKAVTAHNLAEIKGVVELLVKHVDRIAELERYANEQEAELGRKMQEDRALG